MKLLLEDWTPHDASLAWRIHDAYFAERGIAAWTEGDIPYAGSSNSGVAKQHARLFVTLVRELEKTGALEPTAPLFVLEVGAGQGTFALNFTEALAHGCGPGGRELSARLRYVFSDYARKNLEEALRVPGLARLQNEGTLIPALFDLRQPGTLTLLDARLRPLKGKRAALAASARLTAVFLNYIACVAPQKTVRSRGRALEEKYVRLAIDVESEGEAEAVVAALETTGEGTLPPRSLLDRIETSVEWRRLDLKHAFADEYHRGVLKQLVARLPDATLNYPWSFVDLLRGLRPRLVAGGMLLVNDFGHPDRAVAGQGLDSDRTPVKYGLALTHDTDFVLFDVFGEREKMAVLRTDDGLFELHTAAIFNTEAVSPALRDRFERTHRRRARGQELLDLGAAALLFAEAGRFHEAARLYRRCLEIAPRSPPVIFKLGQACLAAHLDSTAELERLARLVQRGERLDAGGKLDWPTVRGELALRLGKLRTARRILERSLAVSESPARHATLAVVYERLGLPRRAYEAQVRSLELEPDGPARSEALAKLFGDYLAGESPTVRWRPRR